MSRPQVKEESKPLGIYCHIPFCASTCDFCAFYQEKPHRSELLRYLDCMDAEFMLFPPDRDPDTVFWGGGTPGLLPTKDLERLGRAMLSHFNHPPSEWTVEMAPSTVKAEKLKVLRDLGVTRISMGVQSFDSDLLKALGRLHQPKQIYKAWDQIKDAGFLQTNIDLMFALPGQEIKHWEADINEAVRLDPGHISTYCLTFEEDTALYVKLSEGKLKIDQERELAFYEKGWDRLENHGYRQYEVSNFCKPGNQCIHNINTWDMAEWIGYGPSAASQYRGERYQRPSDLKAWANALENHKEQRQTVGNSGISDSNDLKIERVALDDRILLSDALVFGLRMNRGVALDKLIEDFRDAGPLDTVLQLFHRLELEGILMRSGDRIQLSRRGMLIADSIGSAILEAMN